MVELNASTQRLYDLLYTREFSHERLRAELSTGQYSSEEVSLAGFRYVDDCLFDLTEDNYKPPLRMPGELLPGYRSSHMLDALSLLLAYGLDPNAIFFTDSSGEGDNIMAALRYIDNGYLAADCLALLLEHGGNPNLILNGYTIVRDTNFDLWFDMFNQEDRLRYDALAHYWMVLVGYGAKLEDGGESIDMCPGHDVSELRQHRDFYYGMIHSSNSADHHEICFFSKYTNHEIGRF